jgi:hypothetical protein
MVGCLRSVGSGGGDGETALGRFAVRWRDRARCRCRSERNGRLMVDQSLPSREAETPMRLTLRLICTSTSGFPVAGQLQSHQSQVASMASRRRLAKSQDHRLSPGQRRSRAGRCRSTNQMAPARVGMPQRWRAALPHPAWRAAWSYSLTNRQCVAERPQVCPPFAAGVRFRSTTHAAAAFSPWHIPGQIGAGWIRQPSRKALSLVSAPRSSVLRASQPDPTSSSANRIESGFHSG